MKDELNKTNPDNLDDELKDDLNNSDESSNDVKYEENDNWEFEGEALTLNETLLENDEIEINIPALFNNEEAAPTFVIDSEGPAPAKKPFNKKLALRIVAGILVVAIIVASTVFGVFYFTKPNINEKTNPGNVALTVGDTDVTIGMYNYYYTSISQNYITYAGYGYYDLDPTKDFESQETTDEDGNKIKWSDKFMNDTIDQIQYITSYYEAAVKAGITLTEEQEKLISENIDSIKSTASESNKSVDEYLQETYGEYCGLATIKTMLEQCYVAENYYQKKQVEAKIEDDEIKAFYKEHSDDYLYAPFAYLRIAYDEETDVKQADAKKQAEQYASKIKTVDDMKKIMPKAYASLIESYVEAGYFADETEAIKRLVETIETEISKDDESFTKDGLDWLFSDKTAVGSCKAFHDKKNKIYYVILKTGKPDAIHDEVYSVRHILIMPKDDEGNALEDPAKGTKEQFAEAEKEIKKILDEYNKGDKTEYSFATLAEKYSDDTESTSNGSSGIFGGLCAGSKIGDMVKPFESWSTDKSRKYGDVDIVKSKYGYHLIFFIEDTQQYLYDCKNDLIREKENEFVEAAEVKRHEGALKKTTVAQPVEPTTTDDDSDDMNY